MGVIVLGLALEQVEDILHGELSDGLATLDGGLGKLALRFLQLKDALFDRVVDGQTVYCNIDSLVEAMDTIDCLFFDKLYLVSTNAFRWQIEKTYWIPKWLHNNHSRCSREIETQASALQTAQEYAGALVFAQLV